MRKPFRGFDFMGALGSAPDRVGIGHVGTAVPSFPGPEARSGHILDVVWWLPGSRQFAANSVRSLDCFHE